ncbi:MAG: hypothetical protein BWY88_00308 [Synergistetes bacterium ADurb.Bin520]|nr:MAG: hypothetical protein BWY88_00308 [Synergistetes bacterium ADurb.Bin520]
MSGRPLVVVMRSTRCPTNCPALPRMSSNTSGFFFWGIMLDPVQKASGRRIQPNSVEA